MSKIIFLDFIINLNTAYQPGLVDPDLPRPILSGMPFQLKRGHSSKPLQ